MAEEVKQAGGQALPIACDIRDEQQVKQAIEETVRIFGGIDILVNNASAISLTGTLDTSLKRYDLMQQVNVRGTFLVSQTALPHLLKAENPHILTLSPPLDMKPKWFGPHPAYTVSKYGMSMVVLGLAEELGTRVSCAGLPLGPSSLSEHRVWRSMPYGPKLSFPPLPCKPLPETNVAGPVCHQCTNPRPF